MGPPLGSLRASCADRHTPCEHPGSRRWRTAGETLEAPDRHRDLDRRRGGRGVGRRVLTPAGTPQPHLLACPHPPPGSTLASPAAYACWREVESLLARRGSRPAATTALRQAQQTACNSAPLRYEVERLARRARLDLTERTATARTRPLADQYRLTRRGWEVLRLIA
jgi:hypothetical protein